MDTIDRFKLEIYQDEETAKRYKNSDIFCHEFTITGYCSNSINIGGCSLSHDGEYSLFKLIEISHIDGSSDRLRWLNSLTEYLFFVYKNIDSENENDETYNLYIPSLNSYLGIFSAINGDIIKSKKYFDIALKISTITMKHKIAFDYAQILSKYFKNWDKSKEMYQVAIQLRPQDAFYFYKYGLELSCRKYYCQAIEQYHQALKIKPNHPLYANVLAYAMFYQNKHKNYKQCLVMLKNVLKISDPSQNNLRQNTQQLINTIEKFAKNFKSLTFSSIDKNDHTHSCDIHGTKCEMKQNKDDVNIDITNISKMEQLKQVLFDAGHVDSKLNEFKLQLYDFDIDETLKCMQYDRFCHVFCIFGSHDDNQCQFEHNDSDYIRNMNSNIQNLNKAEVYCNYLLYCYSRSNENKSLRQVKLDFNSTKLFEARLYEFLGKIYEFGARNIDDIKTSIEYYEKSYQLEPNRLYRNADMAYIYDRKLPNWDRSQYLFDQVIHEIENDTAEARMGIRTADDYGYYYYTYGMAFKRRKLFDQAIKMFKSALKYKAYNPRYIQELAFSLFGTGDNAYANMERYVECLQCCKKVIEIADPRDKTSASAHRLMTRVNLLIKSAHYSSKPNNLTQDQIKSSQDVRSTIANAVDGMEEVKQFELYQIDEIYANNQHLMNEFDRFWDGLSFYNQWKNKYYMFFQKYELNNIIVLIKIYENNFQFFKIIPNNMMNIIHKKYFEKQIKIWYIKHLQFLKWLKYIPFVKNDFEKYEKIFTSNGILTMESFQFYIRNYKQLKKIMCNNDNDEIDCKILWNNMCHTNQKIVSIDIDS